MTYPTSVNVKSTIKYFLTFILWSVSKRLLFRGSPFWKWSISKCLISRCDVSKWSVFNVTFFRIEHYQNFKLVFHSNVITWSCCISLRPAMVGARITRNTGFPREKIKENSPTITTSDGFSEIISPALLMFSEKNWDLQLNFPKWINFYFYIIYMLCCFTFTLINWESTSSV